MQALIIELDWIVTLYFIEVFFCGVFIGAAIAPSASDIETVVKPTE